MTTAAITKNENIIIMTIIPVPIVEGIIKVPASPPEGIKLIIANTIKTMQIATIKFLMSIEMIKF